MKIFRISLLCALIFSFGNPQRSSPAFFNQHFEWKTTKSSIPILTFYSKDSLREETLMLAQDSFRNPIYFMTNLKTPVCADGVCKLAYIKLYWDLLGNYIGYDQHPEFPLTKFDHDVFTHSDYQKLHSLLSDPYSTLERRKMEDLVVKKPIEDDLNKYVDGVSSATISEIKESVVDGALYTCYTLWHIANGELKQRISSEMSQFRKEYITQAFLYSDYKPYQAFILKKIDPSEFYTHQERIFEIFKSSEPITKAYILKKLPDSFLSDRKRTSAYYELFNLLDINTQTRLIEMLGQSHQIAAQILAKSACEMTKNQLEQYLNYVMTDSDHRQKKNKIILRKQISKVNCTYSYIIEDRL